MEWSSAFWDGVKCYGVRLMRMDRGRTGLFRAEMDRQIRQQGNKDFDYMLHRITLNCNLNMEIAQTL